MWWWVHVVAIAEIRIRIQEMEERGDRNGRTFIHGAQVGCCQESR